MEFGTALASSSEGPCPLRGKTATGPTPLRDRLRHPQNDAAIALSWSFHLRHLVDKGPIQPKPDHAVRACVRIILPWSHYLEGLIRGWGDCDRDHGCKRRSDASPIESTDVILKAGENRRASGAVFLDGNNLSPVRLD